MSAAILGLEILERFVFIDTSDTFPPKSFEQAGKRHSKKWNTQKEKQFLKATVEFQHPSMAIYETFEGDDADDIVGQMKSRVAKNSPFAMRLLIGGMSRSMFMQEVVTRYNDYAKKSLPSPHSSEEFLELMQQEGIAAVTA